MPQIVRRGAERADRERVVLVIDDHPIVVVGIRRALEEAGGGILRYASCFSEGFRMCRDRMPDIIVADLSMGHGGLSGLSFLRRFRRFDPDVPILILTMYDSPLIAREALRAGANGFVLKDATPEDIIRALSAVLSGSPFVSPIVASDLAFLRVSRPALSVIDGLSPRERLVLSMLAEGRTYAQIASNLALSYKSVAHICNRLKPKLGVGSLQELVNFAVENSPTAASTTRTQAKEARTSD